MDRGLLARVGLGAVEARMMMTMRRRIWTMKNSGNTTQWTPTRCGEFNLLECFYYVQVMWVVFLPIHISILPKSLFMLCDFTSVYFQLFLCPELCLQPLLLNK